MARYRWTLSLLILFALLLTACQPVVDTAAAAADECGVEGSWIGKYEGGPWDDPLLFQSTLVPIDPDGKQLTYVMRLVNGDATFRIPDFADADYLSELVGVAVKGDQGTYDVSLMGYGVNERENDRNEILYLFGVTGTLKCEGGILSQDVVLSVFAADQDADHDGYPDEGAEPFFCHPTTFGFAKQVPITSWCEPSAE